jgi:enoyl-CoA hydratase/carnithine racemase
VIGHGEKRNALTSEDWSALAADIDALASEGGPRVIIVSGQGDTFCAGSDVKEWVTATEPDIEEPFRRVETAFCAIECCPVPVIALISGVAAGAGCQLARACDIRLIADTASMGMPIARLGILPSPAFAGRLLAGAGSGWATRLLCTGELVGAHQAVALGLADEVVRSSGLAARTRELAARIAENPVASVRAAKHAVSSVLHPQRDAAAYNPMPAVSLADFPARHIKFPRLTSFFLGIAPLVSPEGNALAK